MIEILDQIKIEASQYLHSKYLIDIDAKHILVQGTSKDHEGDYTLVLFPLMKYKIGAPERIGEELGEYLRSKLSVQKFSVVKGFLNLTFADKFWQDFLEYTRKVGNHFFETTIGVGQTFMVEFGSPNTNKPLHLGHLRNLFLGSAVSNIFERNGYKVIKACLYNDKGIHICKSMLAYLKFGQNETPTSCQMKGDHLIGHYYVVFDIELKKQIKALIAQGVDEEQAKKTAPLMQEAQAMYRQWEANEPAVIQLWEKMNGWVYEGFQQTYSNLGIHFDKFYYESQTYKEGKVIANEGLEKGVFYKNVDGTVRADLTDVGLDEKVILRSDGTSVYITQDLGTAELKYQEFRMDKSAYLIADEQIYHMRVLSEILKKLDKPYANSVFHLSYGMVELPTGRMKSREGTVIDADDLVVEMVETAKNATLELGKTEGFEPSALDDLCKKLALGALKYYLVKVDPPKKMIFNPEESIDFKGDTGTFIQYTHARICSLLRKGEINIQDNIAKYEFHILEKALLKKIFAFPLVLEESARTFSPSIIAHYVYELAKEYGKFYYELPVLKAENEQTKNIRLKISKLTADTIKNALEILGISAPEKM